MSGPLPGIIKCCCCNCTLSVSYNSGTDITSVSVSYIGASAATLTGYGGGAFTFPNYTGTITFPGRCITPLFELVVTCLDGSTKTCTASSAYCCPIPFCTFIDGNFGTMSGMKNGQFTVSLSPAATGTIPAIINPSFVCPSVNGTYILDSSYASPLENVHPECSWSGCSYQEKLIGNSGATYYYAWTKLVLTWSMLTSPPTATAEVHSGTFTAGASYTPVNYSFGPSSAQSIEGGGIPTFGNVLCYAGSRSDMTRLYSRTRTWRLDGSTTYNGYTYYPSADCPSNPTRVYTSQVPDIASWTNLDTGPDTTFDGCNYDSGSISFTTI